jgi:hypothetical protein
MAHQFKQFSNKLPSGRHMFTGTGTLLALAALGFGINASLFNGKS